MGRGYPQAAGRAPGLSTGYVLLAPGSAGVGSMGSVSAEPPARSREMLGGQGNAIARRQGANSGIDPLAMRSRVRNGRWQRLQRGVYATFSGEPSRETVLWAALLRAGPDAVLSHLTAAERHGLIDEPSSLICITVPAASHPARRARIPGVIIRRSDAILRTGHPAMLPPCTRVEDTVLDLINIGPTFEDAYMWICRAIGRRRTTADRIRVAMAARKKMRWRREIALALGDAEAGALSVLEYRYVHRVERPHGLPVARRQARIRCGTGNRYLDNLYEDYEVCVELDGTAAHPADEQWRDKRRDNAHTVSGLVTLRFGVLDLGDRRCETASAVASLLRRHGWTGPFRACGPGCKGALP
jgi:very-short-patch-repair endonuclease